MSSLTCDAKRTLKLTDQAFIIICMTLSGVFAVLRFNSFPVGGWTDDAVYLITAESLAKGHGFRLINYPWAPVETTFPPGWPILLSPLLRFWPSNYTLPRIFSLLLWLCTIPIIYSVASFRLGQSGSRIVTLLAALNPWLIGASTMAESESSFLFFTLLTLFLVEKATQKNQTLGRLYLICSVITAFYSQLIRTVGFALVIALNFWFLVRKRWRFLLISFSLTSILLCLQSLFWYMQTGIYSIISPGYRSLMFSHPISWMANQVIDNLLFYAQFEASGLLFPVFGPTLDSITQSLHLGFAPWLMNFGILAVIIIGFGFALRKIRIDEVYVVLLGAATLAYRKPEGPTAEARYIIPLLPIFLTYSVLCINNLILMKLRLHAKWLSVLILIFITLILAFSNLKDWKDPIRNRITDLNVGTSWIQKNAPLSAIVMARDPLPTYLYARRKTVPYPSEGLDLDEYIHRTGTTHIMVGPKLQTPRTREIDEYTMSTVVSGILKNPDRYVLVFSDEANNVSIYAVQD